VEKLREFAELGRAFARRPGSGDEPAGEIGKPVS
jgi:hypothetical protein